MPSFTFLVIYILQLDQHCTITFLKFAFSKWALRCIRNSIRTEVVKFILCRSRDYERPLYDQQENPVAACDAAGPRYQSTHRLFCFCFSFIFRSLCFTADTLRRTGRHFASTSESNYFVALVGNASRLPVSRIRKR